MPDLHQEAPFLPPQKVLLPSSPTPPFCPDTGTPPPPLAFAGGHAEFCLHFQYRLFMM